jgi:hypothetical protein
MNYSIAIPSYKRSKTCNDKTLKLLNELGIDKSVINVFVVEEELEEYKNTLNPDYYNEIVVGKKGIVPQREFIEEYYPLNAKILMIDDDIIKLDLTLTDYKTADEFIRDAFITCEESGAFIWGIYPVWNEYFRKTRTAITTKLTYIMAGWCGIINRRLEETKLVLTREGNKEDFERSILYYLKDGKVIRFNKVGVRTKCYACDGSGLGTLKQRLEPMKNGSIVLNEKYPDLTKIKIRKNGLYEVVFKR